MKPGSPKSSGSELLVLSRSSDHARSALFEKTAAQHRVEVVFVPERNWHDEVYDPLLDAADLIESSGKPYALLTCAFDVLIARWSEGEIVTHIESCGPSGVLNSTEANLWPDNPDFDRWEAVYTAHAYPSLSPWRYINGGPKCGRSNALAKLLREIHANQSMAQNGGTTQEILHRMYMQGYPIALDRECSIFQSMLTGWSSEIVSKGGGSVHNRITGSYPMLLHFNGQAPGMREWAERLLP